MAHDIVVMTVPLENAKACCPSCQEAIALGNTIKAPYMIGYRPINGGPTEYLSPAFKEILPTPTSYARLCELADGINLVFYFDRDKPRF